MIQCLRPLSNYSKESPIYIEKNIIKQTDKSNGFNEYKINNELMAHVLILRKF